ncbi:MAG: hypothetical protein IT253_06790 [Chitinophagaceae bacterium]|jgi:gliding motility-associated lipoprotein GldD|nr:hypothetical protein [Chitinophagaceae bacterium]
MKPATFRILLSLTLPVMLLTACNETYTSKKRGYFKIDFPQHQYRLLNDPALPYSFEYPVYGTIVQDSAYFDSNPENPFWRNIDFPGFNARIYLSYKQIGGKALYKIPVGEGKYKDSLGINQFDKLVNDAYTLTSKNDVVASSITDSVFVTKNGISGVYFKVGGNAATAKQFFMTDTVKNFIRGALYFGSTPNADSLKPVQEFLQKDIEHLINTFRWKEVQ